MRVLMISADRGLFGGGIGDAIERHQKYADLAGFLDIIVFASPEYKDTVLSTNLRIFSTKSTKVSHWKKAIKKARELALEGRYDVVVCQDIAAPAGVSIRNETKTPLIISIHSLFFDLKLKGFNVRQWFLSYKIKKSLKSSDAFRVNTTSIEQKLRKWGFRQPFLVQPTPVDIEKFIVEKKERHTVLNILYVGRLSKEKNVEMLISAFRGLSKNAHLTIVGDGPELRRLKDLAQGDERIIFAGEQPYENLPRFYKEADIFVLPSNSESFGKVLIEAAAAQCAIVATRTAGAESILTHEKDAILIGVGDKKALEMALESLCNDMGRQEALGEQALETARKYSFEEGCEQIVQFWKEVAKSI